MMELPTDPGMADRKQAAQSAGDHEFGYRPRLVESAYMNMTELIWCTARAVALIEYRECRE